MKRFYLFFLIIFTSSALLAQDQNIIWQRTIGGSGEEFRPQIIETGDGLIIAGSSNSNSSGEKTEDSRGGSDFWVLKLDSEGEIEWQRTIGGSGDDNITTILKTSNDNYLLGGSSDSPISGEKTEGSQGGKDYWAVEINSNGEILWQETIGGSNYDSLISISENSDGTLMFLGNSNSSISGDRTINSRGNPDYWLLNYDDGVINWQEAYGIVPGFSHIATSIKTLSNGDHILGGTFDSFGPASSYYILRINNMGTLIWDNLYGGDEDELTPFLATTSADRIFLAGASNSDISGDKTDPSEGSYDYWVIELDLQGNIVWQNTLGGHFPEQPWGCYATKDGGVLISGNSVSNASGDKSEDSKGLDDYWIVKLNSNGFIEWENSLGGISNDHRATVLEDEEGFIYVAGTSNSNISADKSENSRGLFDFWILKLNETLGVSDSKWFSAIEVHPNPVSEILTITSTEYFESYTIYTAEGTLIHSSKGFSMVEAIDVSDLASGIYFIQFKNGNQIGTKKFIRE